MHRKRERDRIRYLDYVKIENDELDGSICLLSGLLRIIEASGLTFSLIYIYKRNKSSAQSV